MTISLNEQTSPSRPLSWKEARSRLRRVLERYLNDPPSKRTEYNIENFEGEKSILSWWIKQDLDLYAGALLFSTMLLVLTSMSLVSKRDGQGNLTPKETAGIDIYRSQVAAAVFIFSGSILSLWTVHRRRFLCLNDSENSKRREILKFLRLIEVEEEKADHSVCASEETARLQNFMNLSGTALTDIYPVYRKLNADNENSAALWSRIPSLLMVRGDYIALQIGDVVPANCIAVRSGNTSVKFNIGDRLSLDCFPDTAGNSLPKGRTTLQADSEFILTLCNQMQIFEVLDTPLDEFIRRNPGSTKPSQISRKVKDVRKFLSVLAVPIFTIAAIAVFARPKGTAGEISLIAPLPILAALGILPVVGPFFVFILEVVGTARILTHVHPYCGNDENVSDRVRSVLLLRYMFATGLSRLSLWEFFEAVRGLLYKALPYGKSHPKRSKLIRVPPASLNVLEKLGVATALALVDDELACEPHSIPQQLLIPSGRGLKLLDLCPEYDDEIDNDSISVNENSRKRGKSFDSDTDSDDSKEKFHSTLLHRKILRRRDAMRGKGYAVNTMVSSEACEVQFEEPTWWQHLPSLKCIGLACLIADGAENSERTESFFPAKGRKSSKEKCIESAKASLAKVLCNERRSHQLRSLAECIGFSTRLNSFGDRGDISPYTEKLRLHVLSDALYRERLELDAHERSSEQSRWWGLLRPDATCVVVMDDRTQAFQVLTVGDPSIITNLCNEAWQGEISTILPLGAIDKQTILETTNNWKLADLDVAAFCYAPIPHSLESRLAEQSRCQAYLLDNAGQNPTVLKDKTVSKEWALIRNQIFLGVLGSLVVPRREIQKLLEILSDAGVRFVYFSPRNMRRQKELAIQMGIDVAWNCAISLRPLQSGEEDPHRMMSNYADWDVNAKLPHGVNDVRRHLKEVDNVPLLVSLFTDVTKSTTKEMVEIFQDHSDTVISIGLSHLPMNDGIFSVSDISVGIDVLSENSSLTKRFYYANIFPSELEFVSSVAAHSCAFRFRGATSVSQISTIIEKSRASLEAAIAAATFVISGCISFSLYVMFSVCMPSTTMTYVPMLGAVIFLQILLPGIALAVAMSDGDSDNMKRVPPKNDKKVTFGRNEGYVLYSRTLLKAFLPALLPEICQTMVYGSLFLEFEPELLSSSCPGSARWIDVLRCDAIRSYSGKVRTYAGCLVLLHFVICIIGASGGYVHRFQSILQNPPWKFNQAWVVSIAAALCFITVYVNLATEDGIWSALPFYYYVIIGTSPFLCLLWVELWKVSERRVESRSEKLRRLQFETRLGAWSPR